MEHELDFGFLGPLVVRRAGAVLDPGRRKQRLLLIRLLLADGRAVAGETLCEELWSPAAGRTPGGATASLHAHVSKVRAVLEPPQLRRGTFEVLVTEPAGYALRVPPGNRDAVRFERAAAQAHRLLGQGRTGHVVQEADRALNMWRGAALADAAHHLFASQEAARLEELRQSVREARTTALLLDGRTMEAVEAARELTVENPLRETGWALLLRALYTAGRHPEALQRYTDLRRLLSDELGLDPGPQLRALHDGILRHDLPPLSVSGTPGTAGPAADTGTGTAGDQNSNRSAGVGALEEQGGTASLGARPVAAAHGAASRGSAAGTTLSGTTTGTDADPGALSGANDRPIGEGGESEAPPLACPMQLPRDLPVFAGRTAEGARLGAMSAGPESTGAPVVVIGGAPGVGKTTFAVHHAHRLASSFPDGQLFVNLCGFHPRSPAVEPGDALHGFLTALGVPATRIPEDTAARSTLFRSLLAHRRILLVLDNARDEQQVRPLLPAGSGCLTLITSRNQLPGLLATDAAKPLTLALPSPTEAHETLARRLGAERLAAEPAAGADLVRLCGRLPLALAVVAARAELDPAFPLHAIADDLRQTPGGLEAFTGSDTTTDVRSVFSWSYRSLREPAARLFRLLALHPGPDITAPAAAGLAALPLSRTRRLLADLTHSCLLEQPLPGRFALHDLLRSYATELTHTHDATDERHHATVRVLDHYVFTAHKANRLLKQDSEPERDFGSPSVGVTPEDLTTVQQADRWLGAEHRVLSSLLHTAVGQGLDRGITGVAWALKEDLNRREYWPEAITALTPALEVARRRGDRLEEGRCLRHIGSVHGYLGHQEQSLDHLRRATRIFEEIDVVGEQARAHYGTACALYLFGRIPEAVASSEQGLALSRATGDELWTAECLVELAWFHSNLGQLERSLEYSEEALTLFQRLDAPWQQAQGRDVLGHNLRMLGRYEESVATYQRAMHAFEELGDHRNAVGALMRLGDTRLAMGDREAARADWVRALAYAEQRALSRSAQEARDRLAAPDAEADPATVVPERAIGNHRLPTPASGDAARELHTSEWG
ncbi:tetratricopeptide repeat protein [Streptomyces tauricus]|uniref:Tetratricopeptide repeat protein n=1 Tax=Streptomyces tauricus TaxID=68274 RepID=A0ABZ1JXK2_9ACTN|nr:BTAD domain-containing putative transcriptional regulator [Streptomyces tauricus]